MNCCKKILECNPCSLSYCSNCLLASHSGACIITDKIKDEDMMREMQYGGLKKIGMRLHCLQMQILVLLYLWLRLQCPLLHIYWKVARSFQHKGTMDLHLYCTDGSFVPTWHRNNCTPIDGSSFRPHSHFPGCFDAGAALNEEWKMLHNTTGKYIFLLTICFLSSLPEAFHCYWRKEFVIG